MNQRSNRSVTKSTGHERLRIVVLGYIVRGPIGGMAWHHLNYALGFARLGHDVMFMEDSSDEPACYDPSRHVVDADPTFGLAFAGKAFDRVGLGDRWCYHDAHTSRWHGPMGDAAIGFCRSADLLINVSAVNPIRVWTAEIPIRVLVDTDPVFTQVRHLTEPARMSAARLHNRFLTFGENIASGHSLVPADGLPWRPTRQPIVLDAWPVHPPALDGAYTTVMQWDSYPVRTYDGIEYGMKSRSFDDYLDMPQRVSPQMSLALGGAEAPRDRLADHGWLVSNSLDASRDPWVYQSYIQSAKAEWSVAKHGYAVGRCGWFSERSACFLATGRPVVVQDTGIGRIYPTGSGMLTFSSLDEAVDAIRSVEADYARHCIAARQIAEEYFASNRVLTQMLDQIDSSDVSSSPQVKTLGAGR